MSQERPTNRRQFFQGKSAAEALSSRVHGLLSEADSNAPGPGPPPEQLSAIPAEPYLVQVSRRAMACEFEVIVNAGQYADAADYAIAALDLVEQLESQLTVYRDTSEISAINRQAANGWIDVEPRLFKLLMLAAQLHRETDGAFDITAGPLARAWGFFQRKGGIPSQQALAEALACVGMGQVAFTESSAIRFAQPGVEINLGAIGKGYALDRAAELLAAGGVHDFLLHGGQSSVLARGSKAGGEGWVVGLRDPLRIHHRLAEITLRDRALGTSGTAVQFFRHAGRRYGHILDPRTGWPVEGVLSATAIAATAAQADALATAFYVLGVEQSMAYCDAHPGIGAILVGGSEATGMTGLSVGGLSEDEFRLLR